MRRLEIFLALVMCIMCFSSCGKEEYDEKQFFAMDTVITVKVEKGKGDTVFEGCSTIIEEAENTFSNTIEGSEVYRFNDTNSDMEEFTVFESCSYPLLELITKAIDISEKTDGLFDITVEPLTSVWDVTAKNPSVPDSTLINRALANVGYGRLRIEDDDIYRYGTNRIDVGGIAKGYALASVCDYLRACGVKYANVSFGGNIGLVGEKPSKEKWSVGIKNPFDTSSTVGTLSLDGGYVAVSGDYERYFELDGVRYHHIIDPFTGYPAKTDIHSVAVICDDAVIADGLSTALFIMGYKKSIDFYNSNKYDFEAVFVTDDGVYTTEGIKDNFKEN